LFEVVVMPLLMSTRTAGIISREISVQIDSWAKRDSYHLAVTEITPVAMVLKTAGILMVTLAKPDESIRLNAFYAHPIMASKDKPHAHSPGLVRGDRSEPRSILRMIARIPEQQAAGPVYLCANLASVTIYSC
jgi:hypothetical protein